MTFSELEIAQMHCMGRFSYCRLKEYIDAYGDVKQAEVYVSLLRRYFPTQDHRKYLKAKLLTPRQWNDLRRLVTAVKTRTVTKTVTLSDKKKSPVSKIRLSEKERALAKRIRSNRQELHKALSVTDETWFVLENDYREFGRADMVMTADDICYPVELKDETANDRVSGQIDKYVRGAITWMKSFRYNWVQGVVIAPAFTEVCLNQLWEEDVIPLQLALTEDSYTLTRIDKNTK